MKILILTLSFFIDVRVHADMIFLNLNDAPEEIASCKAGVAANNEKAKKNPPDQLMVINAVQGENADDNRSNTYHVLKKEIKRMLAAGKTIDSMVISGEDGSGHFFGTNGDFHQNELRDLVKEFPQLSKSLKSAALWGCYTTSVHGAEQFWVNRLPNMQFTMGFTLQGPEKSRPANHALLKQFCERHEEAVKATSKDQLCAFFDSLTHLTKTSIGVCNREAVATVEYKTRKEKCFTYEELHKRCGEFTKDPALEQVYQDYMSGRLEPDDESHGEKASPLRNYYNQLNLWRHCREQFKADRGYDMPYLPEVIRLIKYGKIRDNLSKLNAKELADYDRELKKAGLGALALGDISNHSLTRAQMNQRIENAISALRGQTVQVQAAPVAATRPEKKKGGGFLFDPDEEATPVRAPSSTIRAVNNPTLLRMAQCMRMTFVNMDYRCTQFKNINDRMGDPSSCLMTYNRAKTKGEDDDC